MPVRWLLEHPFRSDEAIAGTHSATLFLHSPDDAIIPFPHGEAMFAKAAEPKRLVRLAGGHIYPNAEDADRYTAAIHDFLSRGRPLAGGDAAPIGRRGGRRGACRAAASRRRSTPGGPPLAEGEPRWNLAEYELQYVAPAVHAHRAARRRRSRCSAPTAIASPTSPLAWYELGRALAAAGQPRRRAARAAALDRARAGRSSTRATTSSPTLD